MATVAEIFERAERCFEMRVAQLLREKREKAEETGAVLNPRKAKRDARTAAGKEKLDALVRRLADLAVVQERVIALHCPDPHIVGKVLHGAAGIWLSAAATSPLVVGIDKELARSKDLNAYRELLDVRGKSSDGGSFFDGQEQPGSMFHATKSVVNYVLGSDSEAEYTSYSPRSVLNTSMQRNDR